jgi:hypothetical protein
MPIGQLPESMEKYRALLEFQNEMRKLCIERYKKYKLEKGREEKRRVKETKRKQE